MRAAWHIEPFAPASAPVRGLVSFISIILVGASGCRAATQIDVIVSTDVACAQVSGTAVTTGTLGEIESIPPSTTTTSCANQRIGSVVLIPSGDESALVGFKVVTAINGATVDQCVPDDAGSYGASCIVARRALRYLPHTSLQVDVLMSGQCAGKACDAQSTCVQGTCVPATIGNPAQCEGSGCSEEVLEPDGGLPEVPDATLSQDGSADAQTMDATLAEASGPGDAGADAPEDAHSLPLDSGPPGLVPGCDLTGTLPGAAWPMEEYCATHRNRSPFVGPSVAPGSVWTHNFGGKITAAPSIGADGTLYVAIYGTDAQSAVVALDPLTGSTIWQYVPGGGAQFASMPILASDHTARVIDFSGRYDVLDLDGGAFVRGAPLALSVPPSTMFQVHGGVSLVGTSTFYASDNESNLIQFNENGAVSWAVHNVSSDFVFPTVQGDGTVMTTGYSVTGIHPDGGIEWAFDSGMAQQLSGVSVATDGTLRVLSPYGDILYALAANGAFKWAVNVGSSTGTQLAISDNGTTYVGAASTLTSWDADGNAAGTYAEPCSQPVIDAAGDIYDYCDGYLVKLDAALTTVKWSFPLPFDPAQSLNDSPILGPNNTIYLSVDTESSDLPDGGPADMIIGFVP